MELRGKRGLNRSLVHLNPGAGPAKKHYPWGVQGGKREGVKWGGEGRRKKRSRVEHLGTAHRETSGIISWGGKRKPTAKLGGRKGGTWGRGH